MPTRCDCEWLSVSNMNKDLRNAFIEVATWHGTLDEAEAMLQAEPALSICDIHTAAITGNVEAIQRFLSRDPLSAQVVSAPYGCNALVYLCLSKYLRLRKERDGGFYHHRPDAAQCRCRCQLGV